MVILDSPPIGLVTDSAILSTIVDGTILVCAVGESDINATKRAKDLLDKVNANILGVVLNKVPINGGVDIINITIVNTMIILTMMMAKGGGKAK